MHLLQELHLILDAGTSLKLFNYDLGGTETGADLTQQNLIDTEISIKSNNLGKLSFHTVKLHEKATKKCLLPFQTIHVQSPSDTADYDGQGLTISAAGLEWSSERDIQHLEERGDC